MSPLEPSGAEETQEAISETAKSSSKCSVKSAKSKSASQASLKKESASLEVFFFYMKFDVHLSVFHGHTIISPQDVVAADFNDQASSAKTAKSSSKSSVRSKASKTSVKSNSGSQASLKDTSPQVL